MPACGSHPAPRRRRSRLSTKRMLASLNAPHHCIPRGSSTPPVERSSATAAHADTNAPAIRGTRDLGSQLGGVKRRCSQWGRGRPRAPETGASPARKRQRGRRRRRRREDGGEAAARRKRAIAPRRRSGARRAARSCPRGTGTARRCPHLYFRRLDEVPGLVRYSRTQPPIAAADPHPLVEVRDVESDGGGRPIKERRGLVVSFSRYVTCRVRRRRAA